MFLTSVENLAVDDHTWNITTTDYAADACAPACTRRRGAVSLVRDGTDDAPEAPSVARMLVARYFLMTRSRSGWPW